VADPMRIRATLRSGRIEVRVLIAHPMETGLRKDEAGNPIPAWYITDVTARVNDRIVMKTAWGTAVSKDPLLVFHVLGGAVGDRVTVDWIDNRGDRRTDEATVVAPASP